MSSDSSEILSENFDYKKEGNLYDVSEMHSDDDQSVMSFATINQDRYFLPPEADLDDVITKLMSKKSKGVIKMEQSHGQIFTMMKDNNREQLDNIIGGDKALQFEKELAEIRELDQTKI